MIDYKLKKHKKLQQEAINKALTKLIGGLGRYYVNENYMVYNIYISGVKEGHSWNLTLPSFNDLINEAKKTYNYFDDLRINKILYTFCDIYEFPSETIINAKDSNLRFYECYKYKKINIVDCDEVDFSGGYITVFDELNVSAKNRVALECLDRSVIIKKANLSAQTVQFIYSKLDSNNCDLNINGKEIEFRESSLTVKNLNISSNNIILENGKLKVENKTVINSKGLEDITSIISPKIIYNNIDITDKSNDKLKLIQSAIGRLKIIKKSVENNIDNEIINTKDKLNSKSISKILKK